MKTSYQQYLEWCQRNGHTPASPQIYSYVNQGNFSREFATVKTHRKPMSKSAYVTVGCLSEIIWRVRDVPNMEQALNTLDNAGLIPPDAVRTREIEGQTYRLHNPYKIAKALGKASDVQESEIKTDFVAPEPEVESLLSMSTFTAPELEAA